MKKDREEKKIEININIAGEQMLRKVPFDKQNFTREVEADVNNLFSEWRRRYPSRSDKCLLAMIAYQYASFYKELADRHQAGILKAEECLRILGGRPADSAE